LKPSGALWIEGATSAGATSEHVGDVHGVGGALLRAPVGLIDLLLHRRALERAIGEGVDGVEVHVVVGEELLELVALGRALRKRRRGVG